MSFHVHHHFMLWSEPVSSKALPCHDNNPLYFFCCCLAGENLAPLQFGKSICCQDYSPGNGDSVDRDGQWQTVASAAQWAQFRCLNLGSCQRVKSAATTTHCLLHLLSWLEERSMLLHEHLQPHPSINCSVNCFSKALIISLLQF